MYERTVYGFGLFHVGLNNLYPMMQLNDHIQHSNFNVSSESILKTFMKLVSQIHHRIILHCFHLKARERTDRHKHTRAHTYTLRIRSCKFALTSLSDDFFSQYNTF